MAIVQAGDKFPSDETEMNTIHHYAGGRFHPTPQCPADQDA
jgi:hypothetical protein